MKSPIALALFCLCLLPALAAAAPCTMPDDGTGTIPLPADCPDGHIGTMVIVGGLPTGSTLEVDAVLNSFFVPVSGPGGDLGGEYHVFEADLHWHVTGTGDLEGFTRDLVFEVSGEIHTGPRNAGDAVQEFGQAIIDFTGELYGDPDFCMLNVQAGDGLGLPSPGACTLSDLGDGTFNVDSFFDITYRIDFMGCPGSILEGMGGSTEATSRFQAGEEYFPTVDHSCVLPDNGDGTIDWPPACPDGYLGFMQIVDGLPPGTTIDVDATLTDFTNVSTQTLPDGAVTHFYDATLQLAMTGTGDLTGYTRSIACAVYVEDYAPPKTDDDELVASITALTVSHYGDPDFCTLEIRAGAMFGLPPSPGTTTLYPLPSGDFAVDSFFDITYQIEFEGCPGSPLDGLAGTTLGTHRFQAGESFPTGLEDETPRPTLRLSCRPNPFNPVTEIVFEVPADSGLVTLNLFDLSGRCVRELASGRYPTGVRTATWHGDDDVGRAVAAGVYLVRLRTNVGVEVLKVALIR